MENQHRKNRMSMARGIEEKQIKLIAGITVIILLSFWGAVGYVAVHFITKYW